MKPALIYTGLVIMVQVTCCVCRGSTANTESGYRYEYVHPLLDKGVLSSQAATTHHLNWTPYRRRSFEALLEDILLERQAFTGLLSTPVLGLVAGVGGVSVKEPQSTI